MLTIHEQLALRLGIGNFAGGILASIILLMMTVLPVAMINRSRKGGATPVAELFIGLTVLGFCVAVTWFPVAIYVVICLIIAVMFSDKISGVFGK